MGIFSSKVIPTGPSDEEIKNAKMIKMIAESEIYNEQQNINNTMTEVINRATMNVLYALADDILDGHTKDNILILISENSNSSKSFEYLFKAIKQIMSDEEAILSLYHELKDYLIKNTKGYIILKKSLQNITNLIYFVKDDSEIEKMAKKLENTDINILKNNIKNIYVNQYEIETVITDICKSSITTSLLNSCNSSVLIKKTIDIDKNNAANNNGNIKISDSELVKALNTCINKSSFIDSIVINIVNKINIAAKNANEKRILHEKELEELHQKELQQSQNIKILIFSIITITLIVGIYLFIKYRSDAKNQDLSE